MGIETRVTLDNSGFCDFCAAKGEAPKEDAIVVDIQIFSRNSSDAINICENCLVNKVMDVIEIAKLKK